MIPLGWATLSSPQRLCQQLQQGLEAAEAEGQLAQLKQTQLRRTRMHQSRMRQAQLQPRDPQRRAGPQQGEGAAARDEVARLGPPRCSCPSPPLHRRSASEQREASCPWACGLQIQPQTGLQAAWFATEDLSGEALEAEAEELPSSA